MAKYKKDEDDPESESLLFEGGKPKKDDKKKGRSKEKPKDVKKDVEK